MRKIRYGLIVLGMLLCMVTFTKAEVSVAIGLPHVSIGINLPFYPELVPVAGYPVYYAPRIHANYFFYDGMYWVYQDDNWYASNWYDGPWWFVEPEFVPLFILRVPVHYYLRPPMYFRRWHRHEPPRWGEHWGHEWERRHSGWDRWERHSAPRPAPLPVYQREYSGKRYPRVEQQQELRDRYYRYQPRDTIVREHVQPQLERRAPAPAQRGRQEEPPMRNQRQPDPRYSRPVEKNPRVAPVPPPRRGGESIRRDTPAQAPPQQRGPAVQEQRQQPGDEQREREQVAPKPRGQEQGSQDRGVKNPQKQAPAPAQNREQVLRDRRHPPEQVKPRSRGQEQKSWKGEDWQAPKRDRGKEHEREQD